MCLRAIDFAEDPVLKVYSISCHIALPLWGVGCLELKLCCL